MKTLGMGSAVVLVLIGTAVPAFSAGTWSARGSLAAPRRGHAATLLQNGDVLVTGGTNASGSLAISELYHAATGTWSTTGVLGNTQSDHTATLLQSGKVLAVGGDDPSGSTEIYDPAGGHVSGSGG